MIVARVGDVLAVIAIPVGLAVAAWLRGRRRADAAPSSSDGFSGGHGG